MDQDTPVKNERNEYFHYSCADHDGDTLIILKKSEIGEGDVCAECKNELVYIDPSEEDDD